MKILVVSQYFWPETFIINDLVKTLSLQGHEVVVATGKPNYPEGRLYPGYKSAEVQRETFSAGIDVVRVPLRPRGNGSAVKLLLNYFSFVLSGVWYFPRLLQGREFDIILMFAPSPITSAIPAIYLKWRKKSHLAIWVQDLWPESLSATGFIHKSCLLGMVGWLVRGIYACADTLLIQSKAFHAPMARYARPDKLIYYPNSVDMAILSDDGGASIPDDLASLLESHFCIVFAGNIGKAQAVETLVDVAINLKDMPDCKLVLVGSGSMLEWTRERKIAEGLDNLVLAGRFPMDLMPKIYRRAAGLVVTLKDEEIFSYTIPSKVQAYLAAGKPIIAALNGEGARIVREASAGFTCPAEDAKALTQAVRNLYGMTESERDRIGDAGRTYFLEHFEMNRQAQRLVEVFEKRIAHIGGES
jgi:glycosyltransferase involved in cell wall biosynthesis